MRNKDTILLENAYKNIIENGKELKPLPMESLQRIYNIICDDLGGIDHVINSLKTAAAFYQGLNHKGKALPSYPNRKDDYYNLELELNGEANNLRTFDPEYQKNQEELRKRRDEEGELPNYGLSRD